MVFLKQFFEKDDFEKNQQTTKNPENYPSCKEINPLIVRLILINFGRLNKYAFVRLGHMLSHLCIGQFNTIR